MRVVVGAEGAERRWGRRGDARAQEPTGALAEAPRVGRGTPRAGGLCRTRSPTENCDQKLGVRAVVKV